MTLISWLKYNHEIKKIIIYVNVMMVIYILIFKEIKIIGKKFIGKTKE